MRIVRWIDRCGYTKNGKRIHIDPKNSTSGTKTSIMLHLGMYGDS